MQHHSSQTPLMWRCFLTSFVFLLAVTAPNITMTVLKSLNIVSETYFVLHCYIRHTPLSVTSDKRSAEPRQATSSLAFTKSYRWGEYAQVHDGNRAPLGVGSSVSPPVTLWIMHLMGLEASLFKIHPWMVPQRAAFSTPSSTPARGRKGGREIIF